MQSTLDADYSYCRVRLTTSLPLGYREGTALFPFPPHKVLVIDYLKFVE